MHLIQDLSQAQEAVVGALLASIVQLELSNPHHVQLGQSLIVLGLKMSHSVPPVPQEPIARNSMQLQQRDFVTVDISVLEGRSQHHQLMALREMCVLQVALVHLGLRLILHAWLELIVLWRVHQAVYSVLKLTSARLEHQITRFFHVFLVLIALQGPCAHCSFSAPVEHTSLRFLLTQLMIVDYALLDTIATLQALPISPTFVPLVSFVLRPPFPPIRFRATSRSSGQDLL